MILNPEQLKLYRWYSKEAFQIQEKLIQEEQIGENKYDFIFNLYETLYDTILFQLELVGYMLEIQKNPLDLLFHYNTKVFLIILAKSIFIDFFFLKWNIYVASLAEYENFFTSFVELFNRLYEKEFKKYPSYPKFSIWRLMVLFLKNKYISKLKFSKNYGFLKFS